MIGIAISLGMLGYIWLVGFIPLAAFIPLFIITGAITFLETR